jgi:hypothetical protein
VASISVGEVAVYERRTAQNCLQQYSSMLLLTLEYSFTPMVNLGKGEIKFDPKLI